MSDPFENIKDINSWFKGKIDKQDKSEEQVKAQETEPGGILIYATGRVISQTLVDANQVQSYIKITDDNKDGYILTGKEFYISSSLSNAPSLNSKVDIAIRW